MYTKELEELVGQVREIVTRASEVIEDIRGEAVASETKDDASPVTQADREADALLKWRLTELLGVGWLSEETADSEDRLDDDLVWVVDPLDGTKEFIAGIPEYSVAVALAQAGQPILGLVENPATSDTFWATKGGGAFRNGVPIRVAEGNKLLASRSEIKRGEFAPFVEGWDVVHTGSIEYKLGLIAAGEAAVTLSRGPKWEWDVCAGALIVAEAGGHVSDVFGDPLMFNQPFPKVKGILAGASEACRRALGQISKLGPSDRMDELLAQ
jgi:myo-inositol-1(or 4)-monophosphatase